MPSISQSIMLFVYYINTPVAQIKYNKTFIYFQYYSIVFEFYFSWYNGTCPKF